MNDSLDTNDEYRHDEDEGVALMSLCVSHRGVICSRSQNRKNRFYYLHYYCTNLGLVVVVTNTALRSWFALADYSRLCCPVVRTSRSLREVARLPDHNDRDSGQLLPRR